MQKHWHNCAWKHDEMESLHVNAILFRNWGYHNRIANPTILLKRVDDYLPQIFNKSAFTSLKREMQIYNQLHENSKRKRNWIKILHMISLSMSRQITRKHYICVPSPLRQNFVEICTDVEFKLTHADVGAEIITRILNSTWFEINVQIHAYVYNWVR